MNDMQCEHVLQGESHFLGWIEKLPPSQSSGPACTYTYPHIHLLSPHLLHHLRYKHADRQDVNSLARVCLLAQTTQRRASRLPVMYLARIWIFFALRPAVRRDQP